MKQASDLIGVLREANQVVNPKLFELSSIGGRGGGDRNRRWGGNSYGNRSGANFSSMGNNSGGGFKRKWDGGNSGGGYGGPQKKFNSGGFSAGAASNGHSW